MATLTPFLGWLGPLVFARGTALYDAALTGFFVLGVAGVLSFAAALVSLLAYRLMVKERASIKRAAILTAIAPASWCLWWALAALYFAYTLTTPEPWDRYFDTFGAAH